VSTAARVPETREVSGDDARATLARIGKKQLLVDAFQRLRAADGTSHSRSLAFMGSLIIVQGIIVVLGLATLVGGSGLSSAVADTITASVPGPASTPLREALRQAREVGTQNDFLPLLVGLIGVLFTATVALGQIERGLNRIYGIEKDRPSLEKYTRAFVLAVATGSLFGTAFVLLGLNWRQADGWLADTNAAWLVLRWPLGFALVAIAFGVLLRYCPNRRQPGRTWLAFGSFVAVVLWAGSTVLLGICFEVASTFPETYGPLAGVVALLLWTYVSAFAIFYGVAVAAQLEAVRASAHAPASARATEPATEPAVA
jgi:YihY family inner membrane protein